jgi:hypothetical protein
LALVDKLNREGRYAAVYCNVEPAQAARNKVDVGTRTIVSLLERRVGQFIGEPRFREWVAQTLATSTGEAALGNLLSLWASHSEKPIVLMIDEIDALIGDTLVSVLRQLREGYDSRPGFFPQSVILCGVRDVRDYRIHTSNQEIVTGGSAFNVRAESLRIGNFSQEELIALYGQHTAETGQIFAKNTLELAWHLTEGQPWLVNALAYEVTHKMKEFRDRSRPITAEALDDAKEQIILRRETHLDQNLLKRLQGPIFLAVAMSTITERSSVPRDQISSEVSIKRFSL